jgi:hypothetical protein
VTSGPPMGTSKYSRASAITGYNPPLCPYRNVGSPDRYSCTAVQEISTELNSHYRLGVNATFTTSLIVCLYLGICSSLYITPQCLK